MEHKKRIKFRCYNCQQTYSITKILEPDEKPKLFVNCLFCGVPSVADLNPYRRASDGVVFRGGDSSAQARVEFILPDDDDDPIPTAPAPTATK